MIKNANETLPSLFNSFKELNQLVQKTNLIQKVKKSDTIDINEIK